MSTLEYRGHQVALMSRLTLPQFRLLLRIQIWQVTFCWISNSRRLQWMPCLFGSTVVASEDLPSKWQETLSHQHSATSHERYRNPYCQPNEEMHRSWFGVHRPLHRVEQGTDVEVLMACGLQGGSNMTGTDLCVNKPHCAAAVRPSESEATTSTLPPAPVRTCSVLSGSC